MKLLNIDKDMTEYRLAGKFAGKVNRCYAFQRPGGGLMLFEKCRKELVDLFQLDSEIFKDRLFSVHYHIHNEEFMKEGYEYYTISELILLGDEDNH